MGQQTGGQVFVGCHVGKPWHSDVELLKLRAGQQRGAPKPVSPFGSAGKAPSGPANPFGTSTSTSARPFIEPSGMSPQMQPNPLSTEPWWTKISLGQVVRSLLARGLGLILHCFSRPAMSHLFCRSLLVCRLGAVRAGDSAELHTDHQLDAGHLLRGPSIWCHPLQ